MLKKTARIAECLCSALDRHILFISFGRFLSSHFGRSWSDVSPSKSKTSPSWRPLRLRLQRFQTWKRSWSASERIMPFSGQIHFKVFFNAFQNASHFNRVFKVFALVYLTFHSDLGLTNHNSRHWETRDCAAPVVFTFSKPEDVFRFFCCVFSVVWMFSSHIVHTITVKSWGGKLGREEVLHKKYQQNVRPSAESSIQCVFSHKITE